MGIKQVFAPLWWLLKKSWALLDATRRALLNLLLLALLLALLIGLISQGPRPLKERTTLVLDLHGALVEQFSGSAREQIVAQLQERAQQRQTRLRDVLAVLDAAAKDEHISQLALDLDKFSGGGMAGLHEVAAALQRFKASGKPVIAYGDQYSQRSYLLAAQASEIYLHPMGMVAIEGFGGYRGYYKDALDRLGVSANLIRVGSYKSFGEPFVANGPSPAAQEADAYLYGDLWTRYTAAVESARQLDKGALARGIDELPRLVEAAKGDLAKLALQQKLIDGIKTRDEILALLKERGASEDEGRKLRQIGFVDYQAHLKRLPLPGAVVGVVVAEGEIVDGDAAPGRIGGDSTAALIRQAREDDAVKAIVLRVNSPGGSAFASEIVRRELEVTRAAGKPVVVSMGDVAASGGYWISMAADEVIADASTVTGSIGVFGMLPTAEKLLDKLSIHTGGTTTTWLAGGYDPRRALDPRLAAVVQASIQHIYDEFTGHAAKARRKSVAEIDAVAQGRVWTGAQAQQRGLLDRLGSFDDALQSAARRAKLEGEPRIRYMEREPGRVERLLESFGDSMLQPLARAVQAQLGLAVPAALREAKEELAFANALAEKRQAFAAVVHCLCTAP